MSLSITKLKQLLHKKNFSPIRYFTIKYSCVYIQFQNFENSHELMVYIPSKYDISPPGDIDVYKMDYDDIQTNEKQQNDEDEETKVIYEEIMLDTQEDISKNVVKLYDRPVELSNSKKDSRKVILSIMSQLERLQLCVKNIPYKICVFYNKYLICLRRDEGAETFVFENFNTDSQRKMCITTDLESMLGKNLSLQTDIKYVRSCICNVLSSTRVSHSSSLKQLYNSDNADQICEYSNSIELDYDRYSDQIIELEGMLGEMHVVYNNIKGQIDDVNNPDKTICDIGVKGLQNDIEKTHMITMLKNEIE